MSAGASPNRSPVLMDNDITKLPVPEKSRPIFASCGRPGRGTDQQAWMPQPREEGRALRPGQRPQLLVNNWRSYSTRDRRKRVRTAISRFLRRTVPPLSCDVGAASEYKSTRRGRIKTRGRCIPKAFHDVNRPKNLRPLLDSGYCAPGAWKSSPLSALRWDGSNARV